MRCLPSGQDNYAAGAVTYVKDIYLHIPALHHDTFALNKLGHGVCRAPITACVLLDYLPFIGLSGKAGEDCCDSRLEFKAVPSKRRTSYGLRHLSGRPLSVIPNALPH